MPFKPPRTPESHHNRRSHLKTGLTMDKNWVVWDLTAPGSSWLDIIHQDPMVSTSNQDIWKPALSIYHGNDQTWDKESDKTGSRDQPEFMISQFSTCWYFELMPKWTQFRACQRFRPFLFHIGFLSSWLDNIPIWNKNTPTSYMKC
jgi:hypothetical protein